MAKVQPKHEEEVPIGIGDFTGGINLSRPASLLKNNEAEWIENFYFSRGDSRLKTRFPIKKFSNSAPAATAIDGLYYWNSEWLYTTGGTLYYLDGSKDGQSIGALNGSSKPTFAPFNNVLIIASGQKIEQLNTSRVLSDVTNGPKGRYIYQHGVSLVLGGDPDNKDRIHQSGPGNHNAWTTGTGDYADVGYLDKLEISGCREYADGLYIVFKRGDDGIKTYFLSDLAVPTPFARKVSDSHSARSHYGVVDAVGNLYMMEDKTISMIKDTDRHGKLVVDAEIGNNLANNINTTATGHAFIYPPHGQIWFIPDNGLNTVYVCHYLHGNAWTVFKFGNRKISSAFYLPKDNKLYLGCDDGFIYLYDTAAIDYSDTAGAYTQTIKTKVFDDPPHREKVLKSPLMFYEALADGSFTFRVWKAYGRTSAFSKTVSMTANSRYIYDLDGVDLYDTGTIAQGGSGTNIIYLYNPAVLTYKNFNENIDLDNFQFQIDVTSGGLRLDKFVSTLALSVKRVVG